jgi:transposase InsO family protein
MQINRSGYYRYLKRNVSAKSGEEENIFVELRALHKKSDRSYGSRRMAKGLQIKGYNVGRYRARNLMRKANIECKQRRRFRVTTKNNHAFPIAENVLNRHFTVTVPNCVWVADITYLWTNEGWLYLSVVLDLFSRRVVGWSLASHMREKLVHDALLMAIGRRMPDDKLMHHSDRGCQYASKDYRDLLKQQGITMSMSRKGNCWDNAVMERFFGSLKSERTDNKVYITREQARADVIDYIEMFYNSQRLHSTLGYLSPMQYEKAHYIS